MRDYVFDWRPRHDELSLQFGVSDIAPQGRPSSIWWGEPKENTDQGREGACVGFAWTNGLLSLPLRRKLPQPANDFARALYRSAQKIDEWPGEDYSGTSVLAGAKIAKAQGFISGYRWAFSLDDVLSALAHVGPVVFGVPWMRSMYQTSAEGLIIVNDDKVGGHAILGTGYGKRPFTINGTKIMLDVIRLRNSWGPQYGIGGDGYITFDDLTKLLKNQGEACIPIG